MPLAAQIAVADATVYYDKEYTYKVPAPLEGHIFVGGMVLVPFGRGKTRPRLGVVLSLQKTDDFAAGTKAILDIAPTGTALSAELMAVCKYMKETCFCTWFEAVKTVLPYGAQYKPVYSSDEGWKLKEQLSRYTQDLYSLSSGWQAKLNKAKRVSEKQRAVTQALVEGPLEKSEILKGCDVGAGVLTTLVKNGIIEKTQQDKLFFAAESADDANSEGSGVDYEYTDEQQGVVDGLLNEMANEKPKPALLQGVTGSGKTPVFLALIDAALNKGKTALILVPEIGLTHQMIHRLCKSFGSRVAVQHSGLSHTERLLQWRQIQRGETPVVVGTRSAVFAPLEKIGIIIVDEEHEHTYKSENAPRYNALDIARRRAARHGALLLLASATPAVSDYFAAEQGRFGLFTLNERYGDVPLPQVEIVDIRQDAMVLGGGAALSAQLLSELAENLKNGEQSILLLNRRGYHRAGICRDCGAALKCGDCSVPMVYHKKGPKLLCHYCGKSIPPPEKCPECGGDVRYIGFGTQLIEEELGQSMPEAKILRMDTDSTSRKGSHPQMLKSFGSGEYDILLGTQMVAKGLDFERVSLVGVIGIDSLLFSQGYRAYENCFSLITQVVGRAGRAGAGRQGRAIIQSVDPENPVLNLAAKQDYAAFYKQEVAFRRLALYPPFCTICTIGFASEDEAAALEYAARFSNMLSSAAKEMPGMPLRILGPAPLGVAQLAGSFRYHLTVKCRADNAFRALLRKALNEYNKAGFGKKASVWVDFNA